MKTAVIFDMDGVLLDSEMMYLSSLKKALESVAARTFSIEELSCVIGMSDYDISCFLKERYALPYSIAELERLQNIFFERELAAEGIREMEGLTSFLQELRNHRCLIALASSSDLGWIQRVLATLKIQSFFTQIVSGEEVAHSKPDPEIFRLAASRLGEGKYTIIVIEESKNGIVAAKRAGLTVIAFKGSSIRQDTSLADAEVFSYEELRRLFIGRGWL